MKIDFTKIEGLDADVAAALNANSAVDSAITEYIDDGVKNRVDVAKSEFKQKMDDLNDKLIKTQKQLEDVPDISKEELQALKESKDKNPELQATLDAMKQRTEAAENELKSKKEEIVGIRKSQKIQEAINEYDQKNTSFTVKSDMRDVMQMLAMDAVRYDETSGDFKVYLPSGEIFATDKGAATISDWIKLQQEVKPSIFNLPSGGGASGSDNDGGATKKYGDMSESEKVQLIRDDPDQFQKLRQRHLENG